MLDVHLLDKVAIKKGYKIALLMTFIVTVTVSCGKKGPLYIPKKTLETEQPEKQTPKKKPLKETNSGETNSQ